MDSVVEANKRRAFKYMLRFFSATSVLLLGVAISAFGQTTLDPVGFCNPPATASACTTATGVGGETIGITDNTTFGMFKNGNGGTSVNPWELLVAIPDYTGAAPTISSSSFTLNGVTSIGDYLPTNSQTLYQFAGTTGDSSMNAPNLFCDGAAYPCTSSNEITAHGSLPAFFDVFAYSFSPDIASNTAYTFTVGGAGLPNGTFLAAAGGDNPFTTPFTTAGLVDGHPSTVPEPTSILLLATMGLILGSIYRRRTRLS